MSDSERELQRTLDALVRALRRWGMRMSIHKTKVRVIQPGGAGGERVVARITVEGSPLEQVETFPYLGSHMHQR